MEKGASAFHPRLTLPFFQRQCSVYHTHTHTHFHTCALRPLSPSLRLAFARQRETGLGSPVSGFFSLSGSFRIAGASSAAAGAGAGDVTGAGAGAASLASAMP